MTKRLFALLLVCGCTSLAAADVPWSLRAAASPSTLAPLAALATVDMPAVDVPALLAEDAAVSGKPGPLRVGRPFEVDLAPGVAGAWEPVPGGRVWRVAVRSRGALWLALGFGTFRPAAGAELRVFDPGGTTVLGPYGAADVRDHGQLWLPPLGGDRAVVELFWPAALAAREPVLHLGTVSHGYRPLYGLGGTSAPDPSRTPDPSRAPDAGACEIDVNCPLGANWQNDKHGVVNLLQGGSGYCSGSLIADTAYDCRNYVLTAHHCLSSQGTAAATVFQFNYERPACGSGTPPSGQTVSGSNLRATYATSDFTLLEMSSAAPAEYLAYFNGWSRGNAPATQAWGIHHPNNDEKKISHSPNPLTNGTYYNASHWRVDWTSDGHEGVTEPGSSGSPLFDADHRIVGQLHGGYSACGAAPSSMWDEYGKVAISWDGGGTPDSRLRDWLDAGGSGATTQDGYYASDCGTPGPKLKYQSSQVSDPAGNGNGTLDPGERVTLVVTDANAGIAAATQVVGTLTTSTAGASIVDGAAAWPDIPAGQSRATVAPHFTLQTAPTFPCGGAVALHLVNNAAQAPGQWSSDFTVRTGTATLATLFSDDVEHGTNGWTSQSLLGSQVWTISDRVSHSPTHSWILPGTRIQSDTVLLMPALTNLGGGATLSFWHRWSTENNYDGCVLEYSTDGATWTDAKPLVTAGQYNSSINASAHSTLAGRDCWAGDSGAWVNTTVDLSSLAGRDVRLRFRFATNDQVAVGAGWALDDVLVSGATYACAPVPGGEASARGAAEFTLAKGAGGYALAWSAPAYGGAVTSYKLYRTALGGAPQFHCEADLGAGTAATLATLTANQGFVVVARAAGGDGSFGQDSAGNERAKAAPADTCP